MNISEMISSKHGSYAQAVD